MADTTKRLTSGEKAIWAAAFVSDFTRFASPTSAIRHGWSMVALARQLATVDFTFDLAGPDEQAALRELVDGLGVQGELASLRSKLEQAEKDRDYYRGIVDRGQRRFDVTTNPRTFGETLSGITEAAKNLQAAGLSMDEASRIFAHSGALGVLASAPNLNVATAKGRALSLLALDLYGISRRWYEHTPWLGDRWLRRRLRDAWKPVLDTMRVHQ